MQKARFMSTRQQNSRSSKNKYMYGIDDIELLRRLTGTVGISLTHSELRIVAYLAAKAKENENRLFECSKKELAHAVGISEKTVDRALVRLRRENLIESVPQYAEGGAQLANAYRLIE